jgi:hypothetical protein
LPPLDLLKRSIAIPLGVQEASRAAQSVERKPFHIPCDTLLLMYIFVVSNW